MLDSLGYRFSAGVGGGFVEDRVEVILHRAFADAETVSDFFIGEALSRQLKYLKLTRRKGVRGCSIGWCQGVG